MRTDRQNRLVVVKEEGRRGRDGLGVWDSQVQTSIYIAWINNKVLLHSTGELYSIFYDKSYGGKGYEKSIYIMNHLYNKN